MKSVTAEEVTTVEEQREDEVVAEVFEERRSKIKNADLGGNVLVICSDQLLGAGKYMVGGAFLPLTKIQEVDRDMDSFSNTGLFGATCSYLLPPAHRSCLQWEDFHMA